ncbi:hypothetical protein SEA_LISARA_4 [Arthrobacter phage LiSara]|uniref:Uncharacterized protein n=1 Tax=Arthrobacter phage LiSara TaxID=2015860 RepID=A0A222ZGT9_9CAUD|nr:hypothetical protein KMD21_gp04 [Arthrobacter phage LiSara]ASR83589.1 hypothetical protein SEA_LISARA_4 [Arthrobacter phage LiSara]
MPFRPDRRYPEHIESMHHNAYGGSMAEITIDGLRYATIGQQEALLHDFDVEVHQRARRDYIDDFPPLLWENGADRISPRIYQAEAMRWRFPRGTGIVDMWRTLARNLPIHTCREILDQGNELSALVARLIPPMGPRGNPGRRDRNTDAADAAATASTIREQARRYLGETPAQRSARAAENMREARRTMQGLTPNQVIIDEVLPSRTPEPQGDAMPPEIRHEPWTAMINNMQQAYTTIGNSFTATAQFANEAAAFATGSRSEAARAARAAQAAPVLQLQDGESRWFPAIEHLQPAPLARVTSANRYKALYEAPSLITADTSRSLLTTSLFTGEETPAPETLRKSGERVRNWLNDTYGLTLHPDAVTAIEAVTIQAGRRAVKQVRAEVRRMREDRDNVQAKLDRRIREVNRLLNRNSELEAQLEQPRATPEQEEKARKWDELVAVAAEWNEAPEGDARVRVGKFRLLVHSLKGAAAEAPVAPPVADDLPMGDEPARRLPLSYSIVA